MQQVWSSFRPSGSATVMLSGLCDPEMLCLQHVLVAWRPHEPFLPSCPCFSSSWGSLTSDLHVSCLSFHHLSSKEKNMPNISSEKMSSGNECSREKTCEVSEVMVLWNTFIFYKRCMFKAPSLIFCRIWLQGFALTWTQWPLVLSHRLRPQTVLDPEHLRLYCIYTQHYSHACYFKYYYYSKTSTWFNASSFV